MSGVDCVPPLHPLGPAFTLLACLKCRFYCHSGMWLTGQEIITTEKEFVPSKKKGAHPGHRGPHEKAPGSVKEADGWRGKHGQEPLLDFWDRMAKQARLDGSIGLWSLGAVPVVTWDAGLIRTGG